MDSPAPSVDPKAAFAAAVDQVRAANPTKAGVALASLVGCSTANVTQVLRRKGRCPASWVRHLAAATDVPAAQLRPDLYA